MIKLYGVYRSRALRPLWLLAEAEIPFEHLPVIQAYRGVAAPDQWTTASPAFLEVNPLGQIPVLQDEDLLLTESLAITLYLARRYARRHPEDLGPQSDAELALSEQWALFAATGIEPYALEIQFIYRQNGETTPEGQAALQMNAERLRRPLARLDQHLANQPWLLGARFTVADINVADCLRYGQPHESLLAPYPHVAAWLNRAQSRPAYQKVWALRESEPQ